MPVRRQTVLIAGSKGAIPHNNENALALKYHGRITTIPPRTTLSVMAVVSCVNKHRQVKIIFIAGDNNATRGKSFR